MALSDYLTGPAGGATAAAGDVAASTGDPYLWTLSDLDPLAYSDPGALGAWPDGVQTSDGMAQYLEAKGETALADQYRQGIQEADQFKQDIAKLQEETLNPPAYVQAIDAAGNVVSSVYGDAKAGVGKLWGDSVSTLQLTLIAAAIVAVAVLNQQARPLRR